RTPPLSSPYFFTTPNTNEVGVNRRCVASSFLIAFSTGFIAPTLLLPAQPLPSEEQGKQARQVRRGASLKRRVLVVSRLTGVVAGGHGRGQPGPRAVQPLAAHRGQPLAALPQLERLLQGQPAGLQALDHRGQLVPGLLVAEGLGALRGLRLRVRAVRHDPNPIRRPYLPALFAG